MDDAQKVLLSLLLAYSLTAPAADVEYISPERQQQLEVMFKEAQFTPQKDAHLLQEHEWSCDMYGARTHLQVQRGLKLYKWSSSKEGDWHNGGAQLVSDYKTDASGLVGRKERFEDQVKITKDGLLVSRLTLSASPGTVIAYSVCKTL